MGRRDDEIYARWKTGRYTLADLGEMYGRSPQRIGQILATRHPEHEDETSRSLHRGRLEVLITEIQQVIEEPGYKMAPNGRMAEDDEGNPLVDISARTEAFKVLLVALDSARKLDGLDKPVKRSLTIEVPEAQRQADAAIAAARAKMEISGAERKELEAYRQRFGGVIPGEVIARELPPA